MTKYAAYDAYAIYAIGDTPDEATDRACQDAGDPLAPFQTAPITDEFAARIAQYGWHGNRQSFELAGNGFLVETTD